MLSQDALQQAQQSIERRRELEQQLSSPEVLADQKKIKTLSVEYRHTQTLAEVGQALLHVHQALQDARAAVASDDSELRSLGQSELPQLEVQWREILATFERLSVPPDPHDASDVIMEIRAGVGGDEAALFAHDLCRMYARFAERMGWKTAIVSESVNDVGGFKEVLMSVQGTGAYGWLKLVDMVYMWQIITFHLFQR